MIKLSYISLFIFFSAVIIGQETVFPTSDAKWCYQKYGDTGEDLGKFCLEFEDEKAVIDGVDYAILCSSFANLNIQDVYIREEENKVFLIPNEGEEEILLYDFNLEIGDSYSTDWGWSLNEPILLTVTNIDSIAMFDGSIRKLFVLQGQDGGYTQWIEGVGDYIWLFHLPAYFGSVSGGYSFICHTQNGQLIYTQDNGYCLSVGVNNVHKNHQLEISPNPFFNEFTIQTENISSHKIELLNSLGELLHEIIIQKSDQTVSFAGNHLGAGLYYLRYFDNQGQSFVKTIVKMD